ncbi:hypothetical protein ACHAWX_007232 [Stephanocyclus meneghinianus]
MAVQGTSAEFRTTQPVKELATPTFEDEASLEYDFTPLTEDRREPTEDIEISSDDRVPANLSVTSRSSSNDEVSTGKALASKIRPPYKPTITIDRRARSVPDSRTNSIANIMYVEPPANTETVLGVDLSEGLPLASEVKSESRPVVRVSSKVTENRDPEQVHVKKDKPAVLIEEEALSGVASPASPTPSGISSEHTLDQLYQSMLNQLNLKGGVEDDCVSAYSILTERATESVSSGAKSVRTTGELTLKDFNESRDAASATTQQTAETISSRRTKTGRSSAVNVRSSSRRRARMQFAGSSKTTIADSTRALASTTKSLAASSSKRLSSASKSSGSKSKSLASKSKSVVANVRARSKSRLRGFRTQRQEASSSTECTPVALADENKEVQETKSLENTSTKEEVMGTEKYTPVDVAVEEVQGASADESLEVMVFSVEETNDEQVKAIISQENSNEVVKGADTPDKEVVYLYSIAESSSACSAVKSIANNSNPHVSDSAVTSASQVNAFEEGGSLSLLKNEAARSLDDKISDNASSTSASKSMIDSEMVSEDSFEADASKPNLTESTAHDDEDAALSTVNEVSSTASTPKIRPSSATKIRDTSRKRAQQLSGLGKKLTHSSKSIASNSSRKISSTSKTIASSSKSAIANVRHRSRSRVRGSKAPPCEEEKSVDVSSAEGKESHLVEVAGKKTNESSGVKTDGTSASARASSRKRAQQLSGLGRKFTDSSKAIASSSTKRISSTSKSIAMSSRSAISKVRVRSRSRVPSTKRQSEKDEEEEEEKDDEESREEEEEENVVEESSEEVVECLPGAPSGDDASMESKSNEVAASTSIESEKDRMSMDNNQVSSDATDEERVESDYTYTITVCDAENIHIEESAPVPTSAAAPISVPPPKTAFVTNGFMDRFRSFSSITEQFFSKTEEYWGDFATICGGEVRSATEVEANNNVQGKGAVDPLVASKTDEPTLNSVEVSPVFDEQDRWVVEHVPLVDHSHSAKELTTEVEPILASLDPTPSIELGQSSSLRSTKSNKSLTLLTEVQTKPSTESAKVTEAEPRKTLSMDSVESTSQHRAEEGKCESETRSYEEQLYLASTEVINDIDTSETPVGRPKAHGGLKDLKIRTSFLKKAGLGRKGDSTNGNEEGNEPHSFSVMKSLKTGLKHLSPRGKGGYKGFLRSKDENSLDEYSSSAYRSSTQKPIDRYDADGVRVYGGGITVPSNDRIQYPKHPLYYRRKKAGGIRKHVNQMRETAQSMNKVLQKRIVAASQPRMKAIMTNHVYQASK